MPEFDPKRYLLPGDTIKSIAAAMAEGALAEAATKSGAFVFSAPDGTRYSCLPLDVSGNLLANIILRNATASALASVAGSAGELSVATDVNAVFRHTGVANDAELLDAGARYTYSIPTASSDAIDVATPLPPHTVLYIDQAGTVTGNNLLSFQYAYAATKKGQRYRVINRSNMPVRLKDNNNNSLAYDCPPWTDAEYISIADGTVSTGFGWIIMQALSCNPTASGNQSAFCLTQPGSTQTFPYAELSTAFGLNLVPTYKGQTLIGYGAEAVCRNSFSFGLPEMNYKAVQYTCGLQAVVTAANGTAVLTTDGAAVSDSNTPLLGSLSSSTIWEFDVKIIVKQTSNENCGIINGRALVRVTSGGVATLMNWSVTNEYWNVLTLTAAANIAVAVGATYNNLQITVKNPAAATSLRWRAWVTARGVTNL